jgi:hypothetical protein
VRCKNAPGIFKGTATQDFKPFKNRKKGALASTEGSSEAVTGVGLRTAQRLNSHKGFYRSVQLIFVHEIYKCSKNADTIPRNTKKG